MRRVWIKCFIIYFLAISALTSLFYAAPPVRGSSSQHQIVLPFGTNWGNGFPWGTSTCSCNQVVSSSSNFYGTSGSGSTASLTRIQTSGAFVRPTAYGWGPGSIFNLQAGGSFGGPTSFGVLRLFDNSPDSFDWGPPFRLKPHTILYIWYFHDVTDYTASSKNVMIDAQLYNQQTGVTSTLSTFQDSGSNYVVDQNGLRLNPAYRSSDSQDSWSFATFDLSLIYNNDPGNWFVTMITVRFDNGQTGSTGAAVTYFADVRFTYAVYSHSETTDPGLTFLGPLVVATTAEVWWWATSGQGTYNVEIKVGISGRADADANNGGSTYNEAYPNQFSTSAPTVASFLQTATSDWTAPTGVYLVSPDTSNPLLSTVQNYLLGQAVIGFSALCNYYIPGCGILVSELRLAQQFYPVQSSNYPTSQTQFTWPFVDYNKMTLTGSGAIENDAHVEGFLFVNQVQAMDIGVGGKIEFAWDAGSTNHRADITTGSSPLEVTWSPNGDILCTAGASPTSGYYSVVVNFSSSCSGGSPGASGYNYSWQFGDGSTLTGNAAQAQNPQHTYNGPTCLPGQHCGQRFYPTLQVSDSVGVATSPRVPSIWVWGICSSVADYVC